MEYAVQVVSDGALGGAPWVFVRDGLGTTFLLMTHTAMRSNPCRHLSAAWRVWEKERPQRELISA